MNIEILILRGSATLPLRMVKHSQNALAVASFLESHLKVKSITYPGLKSHPDFELASKQMSAPSGMLNFNLKADMMAHFEFLKHLSLITHAVSLGHDQSLIVYIPTEYFFEDMVVFNEAQKEKYRRLIREGIFRLSVGIKNADDIIEDLRQALTKVERFRVQSSGLKNSQPAPIKGIQPSCVNKAFSPNG